MAENKEIERVAAELFATAWNKLDSSYLSHVLDERVDYISRKSGKKITGKQKLIDYLQSNMNKIKKAGKSFRIFAEIGFINETQPVVLLAQKSKEKIQTLILFEIEWNRITKIYLCTENPHPRTAQRTGEYPGYEDYDDDFEHYYDNDPDEKTLVEIKPISSLKNPKTTSSKFGKTTLYLLIILIVIVGLIILKILLNL